MGYAAKKAIEVILALAVVTVMIAGCGRTPQETDEFTEDEVMRTEEVLQPQERFTVPVQLDDLPQFVLSDGSVVEAQIGASPFFMTGEEAADNHKNPRISLMLGGMVSLADFEQLREPQWAVLTDFWMPNHLMPDDLSFLAGITNLRFLDIEHSSVSDLTFLANLRNLEVLRMRGNFYDLSPLGGLPFLENVRLIDNRLRDGNINDLSPLASLSNLEALTIVGGGFSDLSPLSGLTGLRQLNFSHSSINDLSPLAGLTNLESLTLNFNNIVDISPLANMTNLSSLYLGWNGVADVSPLAGLSSLKTLNMIDNNIIDITPLANLTALESLDLSENNILDFSALTGMTNLTAITIRRNSFDDLVPDGMRLWGAGYTHAEFLAFTQRVNEWFEAEGILLAEQALRLEAEAGAIAALEGIRQRRVDLRKALLDDRDEMFVMWRDLPISRRTTVQDLVYMIEWYNEYHNQWGSQLRIMHFLPDDHIRNPTTLDLDKLIEPAGDGWYESRHRLVAVGMGFYAANTNPLGSAPVPIRDLQLVGFVAAGHLGFAGLGSVSMIEVEVNCDLGCCHGLVTSFVRTAVSWIEYVEFTNLSAPNGMSLVSFTPIRHLHEIDAVGSFSVLQEQVLSEFPNRTGYEIIHETVGREAFAMCPVIFSRYTPATIPAGMTTAIWGYVPYSTRSTIRIIFEDQNTVSQLHFEFLPLGLNLPGEGDFMLENIWWEVLPN